MEGVSEVSLPRIVVIRTANKIPIKPPIKLRVIDSARNCNNTSFVLAPTDIRIPISRVRSVTETSIMFIIPIPPTIKETPAIAPSRSVSVEAVEVANSVIYDWL